MLPHADQARRNDDQAPFIRISQIGDRILINVPHDTVVIRRTPGSTDRHQYPVADLLGKVGRIEVPWLASQAESTAHDPLFDILLVFVLVAGHHIFHLRPVPMGKQNAHVPRGLTFLDVAVPSGYDGPVEAAEPLRPNLAVSGRVVCRQDGQCHLCKSLSERRQRVYWRSRRVVPPQRRDREHELPSVESPTDR